MSMANLIKQGIKNSRQDEDKEPKKAKPEPKVEEKKNLKSKVPTS